MHQSVKVEIIDRNIPTYELGKPEINPVFFEKRVYQGSSGKVYPVPFIDKVHDQKVDKIYKAAILENDFIRLAMLPEIGGRIFEAQDKTNADYDFFYKQKVIKPALVGLAGPWISGGVEFNWPQHHRPGTYLPTDTYIEEEANGAKTIWMSEYDPMFHLKGMHGIRIHPNSSLIELRGRLYNRTPLTQTFLWWANVAVEVHKDYQSFFPPDVNYVADHAVRAMSSFPNAENYYYGIPYHERKGQNDLRNYQNIPVPTSYMVCETNYNFFGGYDFKAEGGFVHVANRHIAPGKKQWTWGNAEFGRAWDRELTDEGGPYFELMAGVYTDNQPDFSYLLPYETKTFSQYWWSYKKLGPVQNANKDVAVRLDLQQGNLLEFGIAGSRKMDNLELVLKIRTETKHFQNINISPEIPWMEKGTFELAGAENAISVSVFDERGNEIIAYHHREANAEKNRKIAVAPPQSSEINSTNELELIGEHLELYRHPTRYPEPYWEAAIARDPKSYKSHLGLGKVHLKNGQFASAEQHFYKAIKIMTSYHPNPASGEAHYFCGLAKVYLGDRQTAYGLFYKATWNFEWRSAAYFQLALLDCLKGDYSTALQHLEASLDTNRQHNKAIVLKATILRKTGQVKLAKQSLESLFLKDSLDQWAKFEQANLSGNYQDFLSSSRNDAQTVIDIAFDYAEGGFYKEVIAIIELHHQNEIAACAVPNPMGKSVMTQFILAWLYEQIGDDQKSLAVLNKTQTASFDYLFPSRIHEQLVLEWVITKDSQNTVAAYGLGNYYYNLKRHEDAIRVWEMAAESGCNYATLHRNLGIAYWNARTDGGKAREAFLKAIQLSPDDARIRYEYDQLRKKQNDSPYERLQDLEKIKEIVSQRDDFTVELAALYNFTQQFEKVLKLLESRQFHPWEGGEGKVLKQYTLAYIQLGRQALAENKAQKSLELFQKATDIPDNLGEKYHPLQSGAHINYWKGKALKELGRKEEAATHFLNSINESGDFVDMEVKSYSELSYYQALSLVEIGEKEKAKKLWEEIKTFGESKLKEKVQIDYFATSLPLLLVFDDDIQKRNTVDAKFLMLLASAGLGEMEKVNAFSEEILTLDAMHFGSKEFLS